MYTASTKTHDICISITFAWQLRWQRSFHVSRRHGRQPLQRQSKSGLLDALWMQIIKEYGLSDVKQKVDIFWCVL